MPATGIRVCDLSGDDGAWTNMPRAGDPVSIDPELGRVTLAGRDLREYRQDDVRRAISVVAQDVYLFSASIRDNLRLARPDATDGEIEQALRRACISEWVASLPDGRRG